MRVGLTTIKAIGKARARASMAEVRAKAEAGGRDVGSRSIDIHKPLRNQISGGRVPLQPELSARLASGLTVFASRAGRLPKLQGWVRFSRGPLLVRERWDIEPVPAQSSS